MALCISRKVNQALLIGDNIRVVLVGVDRGRVRLAIDAPKDVVILREEIACRTAQPPEPAKPGAN